jgi:hypothetical protein
VTSQEFAESIGKTVEDFVGKDSLESAVIVVLKKDGSLTILRDAAAGPVTDALMLHEAAHNILHANGVVRPAVEATNEQSGV